MFDEYAQQLINLLPDLPTIDRVECRRALSTVYYYIVRSQLSIELDDNSISDLENSQKLLRQMVDALESVAVFDRLNGQSISEEIETACAFVAAEALYLLGRISNYEETQTITDPLMQEKTYATVESALLYMIGGYDINAVSVAREMKISAIDGDASEDVFTRRVNNAKVLLSRIILLCSGNVQQPRDAQYVISLSDNITDPLGADALINKIRSSFYARLVAGIDAYLDWLGGYNNNGLDEASRILINIRYSITESRSIHIEFADVYHLTSLLISAMEKTSQRSLVHNVPLPPDADENFQKEFIEYLNVRAQGDSYHYGRPFLWPSALEYIKSCMPGPNKDAVISMPTGSGKSYIAELAITHALNTGWVLYLAPTNALVYQVRRDLMRALRAFRGVTVRAFIGNEEYTTLAEEQINIQETNFVAVMTPEKCSLALRLYPEIFSSCALCIFDECHLINDGNRGITADILISQLSLLGQIMRFILMSAMISNAEQLAEWLSIIHNGNAIPLVVKWRPSRTMRGLLLLDQAGVNDGFEQASTLLRNLPVSRVNQGFPAPLAMIAGLSGPWTMDGPPDYRIISLPISFPAQATRRNGRYSSTFESWKNTSARLLAELFAKSNISTICFVLSSRHHTFSAADKIENPMPNAPDETENFPDLVEAWLSISDEELGTPSVLRDLLRKGVAVHSSAMLQVEQAASEWMFLNKKALLMFATGTLAQGLNLPAVAVVIAGTSMGDARYQTNDDIAGISRVNSLILNGFGRAGRPGFANQGLAILVSDSPYLAPVTTDLDPSLALNRYQVLGERDAAIEVHSPIENFIDTIIASDINPLEVSNNDLILTSLLAEYTNDDFHSGQILTRTLAAYHKRQQLTPSSAEFFRNRFNLVRDNYFIQPNLPDWINRAAMISGVDYFRATRIWQAYNQFGFISGNQEASATVEDWMNIFFSIMALLPPKQILMYLPASELKTSTVLSRLKNIIAHQETIDTIPWEQPNDWGALWLELREIVSLYMNGESYSVIAQRYLGLNRNQVQNSRTRGDHPIPAVFGLLNRIIEKLAIDAGCFVAVHQIAVHSDTRTAPESLQALPLCIRHGFNNLDSLTWYRFGYRQRVCAHALQRNFPIPDELTNDSERAEWVRQTRRAWLSGEIESNNMLINQAKIILLQTENQ